MNDELLLILSLLIFSVSPNVTFDCPVPATVPDEVKRATAVFVGEVIAEEYREIKDGEDAGAKVLTVRIKVKRWWKGNGANEVIMYTSITEFPDGTTRRFAEDFRFHKGESYLIYAFGPQDKLRTSECSRTKKLSVAEEDLNQLGEGYEPTKE